MSSKIEYKIAGKTFVLDKDKAHETANKKVINGYKTQAFNLLPLKFVWAYDLYKKMKANHWEPEDIPMQKDISYWTGTEITDEEKWIIKMAVGYFSAAEGIVGDNILHVVREVVTASELKLVLGRHAHEENIHADSLLYIISSLGIDPYECEAIFTQLPSVVEKIKFVRFYSEPLRRDLDYTKDENIRLLIKNMFVYGLVMEGTQFYSLFSMVLALQRQNKFPGIAQMFRYTMRDESNHIELFRNLIIEVLKEYPHLWTEEFKNELISIMKQGVYLEDMFIEDTLVRNLPSLNKEEYKQYIRYMADRRLTSLGLPKQYNVENPFIWMSEAMDVRKEQNFFEGRVTEYAKASTLQEVSDDEL